ncbi:hypothetical protein BG015_003590 [Linnemannia schmuckeri]|uniref:HCP-like protein n=1 Tax=Linnemannia schmuckeri TaxID=64567 RepID=A0A9P5S2P6_9FUNG|nr:hypothetical protein BG015_003590 [Linnemannia schmuckeri]
MSGLRERWRIKKNPRRRSTLDTNTNPATPQVESAPGQLPLQQTNNSGTFPTAQLARSIPLFDQSIHPLDPSPSPSPVLPLDTPPIESPSLLQLPFLPDQPGGPPLLDSQESIVQLPVTNHNLPPVLSGKPARRKSTVWLVQTLNKVALALSPFSPLKSSKGASKFFRLRRNKNRGDEPAVSSKDRKDNSLTNNSKYRKRSKSSKDTTTIAPTTTTTTTTTNNSPKSLLATSSSDLEDLADIDLRSFYDHRSEDPAHRVVFIAGPEHFYYLALQLETSPRLEYQLYGKDLFIRSAGLGYAPAQFKLGICYELGLTHFPMDPSHSFVWYKRAAMQGHADAELAVSGWYLTGHPQGLIQSEPLAYEWASKAARRGWSKAEYTLGHYHEVGIGVPQDLQLAKQWYLKAAARGNERALLRLLVGHVGLEVDYAHLKDALLAQNENNPYLLHQLAQFHELREYGLVPDEDAAFELYAASAQANYAPAQYKLGACYEFGILGCPRDPVQAVHWYGQGAENGHVEALLALAGFYLDGSAGAAAEQSDEEAFRFVRAAAQRGVPKAEYITGFFLEYGLGIERNPREAKQWYHLACAKGVDSAERRLKDLERSATVTIN